MSNFNKISAILKKYSTDVVSYKLDAEFAYAAERAAEIIELLGYAEENALSYSGMEPSGEEHCVEGG